MNMSKKVLLFLISFGFVGHSFATKSAEEMRAEIAQLKEREEQAKAIKDTLFIFDRFAWIQEINAGIRTHESLEKYVEFIEKERERLKPRARIIRDSLTEIDTQWKLLIAARRENRYDEYVATEEGKAALEAKKKYSATLQEMKLIDSYQLKNERVEMYKKALICLHGLNADVSQGKVLYMKYQQEEADLHTKWSALEQELNKLERASSISSFEPSSARRPNSQPVDPDEDFDSEDVSDEDFDSEDVSDEDFDSEDQVFSSEGSPKGRSMDQDDQVFFDDDQDGSQGNKQKTDSKQKIASGSSSTKWILGGSCVTVAVIASGIALKKYLDERKKEEEKKKKQ